jgi:hypothetical protein
MAQHPLVRQDFHIIEASHTRQKSSGRVISQTQKPLTDNKQHSQGTDIHAPEEFKPESQEMDGTDPRHRPRGHRD